VNEANVHHARGHFVTFRTEQGFNVFAVGAGVGLFAGGAGPGVYKEVEAADDGVARRIIGVGEVGLRWEIAFELNPIEMLDAVLRVGFDEGVEFAVGNAVENKACGADVLGGFGEMDLDARVMRGGDGGSGDLAVWSGLGWHGEWEKEKNNEARFAHSVVSED